MYSKSAMILIFAVALISLTCGSPIDSAETRADTFSRTEKLTDNYTVSWDVDRKTQIVKFTVVADTEGYVGLGFADSGTMKDADIVIGGVNPDKTTYFTDRFAAGQGVPAVDDKQDYTLVSATEEPGKTTLVFTRPFATGDAKDADITDKKTNFIWAIGSTDDIAHHADRGSFAVNILEEPSTGSTTTTTEGSGGAVNLQISSLSCALTVFLIATKYLY